MTASAWDKFLLLSWKNWIIQLRHPIQTVFEVLVPVLVCTLLILIRGLVDIKVYTEDTRYVPYSTTVLGLVRDFPNANLQLAYSPQNAFLQSLVEKVSTELDFNLPVVGRPDAVELLNYAQTYEPFASIQFDDSFKDITEFPATVNYALRFPSEMRKNQTNNRNSGGAFTDNWLTNFKLGSDFSIGPRNKDYPDGGEPPGYISVSSKNVNQSL